MQTGEPVAVFIRIPRLFANKSDTTLRIVFPDNRRNYLFGKGITKKKVKYTLLFPIFPTVTIYYK